MPFVNARATTRTNGMLASALEHAIFVERLLGHSLPNVPELNYAVVLEAEDVDDRSASIFRVLSHAGKNRNPIALLYCTLNLQHLVRILRCILFHRIHQRRGISAKEGVVMTKSRANMSRVCLTHLAGSDAL